MTIADVLVLGAGMAGLAAADELVRHGVDVIVVEARSRVGGRIHTLRDEGTMVPIELGAELLHGEAEATQELAKTLSIGVHEIEGKRFVKTESRLAEIEDYDAKLGRMLGRVFAHVRTGRDLSFAEALERTALRAQDRELVASFVEGFHAGALDLMSTRALAKGGAEGPGKMLRVATGYSSLAEAVATSLGGALRLGRTVECLRWRPGHVTAIVLGPTGRPELLRARSAIIALPLGVLQRGAIAFDPALDNTHRRALASLAMGNVVKITLRFREAFWCTGKRASAAFFHSTRAAIPTFWTMRPVKAPFLVGWAGGPAADALFDLDPSRIAEIAVDALADTLGTKPAHAHELVDAYWIHDWQADPLAGGAYSFARTGGESAAKTFARSIAQTLYFAGEHTALPPDNATVEGAVTSGQRAAHAILVGGSRQKAA